MMNYGEIFRKIEISYNELEKLLTHVPQDKLQEETIIKIKEVVYFDKLTTFWAPCMNPGLATRSKQLIFEKGIKAETMATKLWVPQANLYMPEHGSRLGNKYERTIFVAFLINMLISQGMSEEQAWKEVCSKSTKNEEILKYEDPSMLKITLTENDFELCGGSIIAKTFDVGYNFAYCDNAVGWVILTK